MKTKNAHRNINLKIKNIRCFAEEQQFNIRPLTFLVGENSTGKTTVMGCFSVIMDCISNFRPGSPDFNREPYFMGSFQDIATKKLNGDSKSDKTTFEIGCEFGSDYKYNIHFIKQKKRAEPVIQKVKVSFKDFICSVDTQKSLTIKKGTKELINRSAKDNVDDFIYDFIEEPFHFLHYIIRRGIRDSENFSKNKIDSKTNQNHLRKTIRIIEETLQEMRQFKRSFRNNTISLAPIRSKPKRTYDPIREIPDPEGSEIPVTLMRLSGEERDWKKIHKKLIHFGRASDLFSDIDVKKYGESVGEPFQLQFQVRGFQSNIIDVGYGVSQILPLLVRLFYPKDSRVDRNHFNPYENQFLLQQPEVHLHPKAQAEFASLLVENIKTGNSFLIETHSDYMIDRARIEIRKKNISPHDVSLIYLEPTKKGVQAHNMSFDEQGNLIGAPKGFRDFFIKESNRFLGFED